MSLAQVCALVHQDCDEFVVFQHMYGTGGQHDPTVPCREGEGEGMVRLHHPHAVSVHCFLLGAVQQLADGFPGASGAPYHLPDDPGTQGKDEHDRGHEQQHRGNDGLTAGGGEGIGRRQTPLADLGRPHRQQRGPRTGPGQQGADRKE